MRSENGFFFFRSSKDVFINLFTYLSLQGKCLAFMGVPMKNGGHILFPEEAVYLIEHCNAYATDGGRLLTLYDGYRILQECSVSMHKFRAYSALRQGGFVVLRPKIFLHSLPKIQSVEREPLDIRSVKPM
ncbi:unnamed protein product [Angiostrongylus costaricensis]|uniref:ESCRT-II complex subunit VPS36 n=1 Tax=Angiostrongylus costaricensis TaxID=334426 RepID=A0A0R3PQH6_ANGCS|nr:unnamed protein product [Angiostrongylus costaricensis]